MGLRQWRESNGWSQQELAELLGLRWKSQISGYETGAKNVATDLAIAIDRLTAGAVPVAELRPDLDDVVVLRPGQVVASRDLAAEGQGVGA